MSEFYFSLPRLLLRSGAPSERNVFEAHFVGTLEHLVVYFCAWELCLTSLPGWAQLILSLPLAVLVFLGWLLLFYLNSRLLRLGLFAGLPRSRAQNNLVGLVATAAAFSLLWAGHWHAWIGALWLALTVLNLFAAAVLALDRIR